MDEDKRRDYSLSFAAITLGLPVLICIALWRGIKGFGLGVFHYIIELKELLFDEPS